MSRNFGKNKNISKNICENPNRKHSQKQLDYGKQSTKYAFKTSFKRVMKTR